MYLLIKRILQGICTQMEYTSTSSANLFSKSSHLSCRLREPCSEIQRHYRSGRREPHLAEGLWMRTRDWRVLMPSYNAPNLGRNGENAPYVVRTGQTMALHPRAMRRTLVEVLGKMVDVKGGRNKSVSEMPEVSILVMFWSCLAKCLPCSIPMG